MLPPNVDPVFAIAPGTGGLPKLALAAPDGAGAEVYLQGAHVTSWIPAGGLERLFLSRASEFRSNVAIRGGVPVIFPQFSGLGPLPRHGFACALPWVFTSAEATADGATATFQLCDSESSRRIWPHAFCAELTVSVGKDRLAVTMSAINTGEEVFTFTAALHTYLAVADIATTSVEGLAGLRYRDTAAGGVEDHQAAARVAFKGEVDRIYFGVPAELRVVERDRTTRVLSAGFPDAVVWNPGAAKGATVGDLEPDGYRRFVCLEAAVIGTPMRLASGQRWQGTQTLVA